MATKNHLFHSLDSHAVRESLRDQGYFIVGKVFDQEFCRTAISFIDSCERDEKAEVNYSGSELRIWDSQRKHEALSRFFDLCTESLEDLLQDKVEPKTLLAIRNQPIDPQATQLRLGRWHLDSFFRQLKIFLFLTDTNEYSGPFEFIPGSQRRSFKFRMLCNGTYLRPSDLVTRKRAYQAIADERVEGLSDRGYPSTAVLCEAGTVVVVDTSVIHRARPCLRGSRYALTAYYR